MLFKTKTGAIPAPFKKNRTMKRYAPPCGAPTELLPATTNGSQIAFDTVHRLMLDFKEKEPEPDGLLSRFLRENTSDDQRKALVKEALQGLLPRQVHPYEMAIIARSTVQTQKEFELLSPLVRWYLTDKHARVHDASFVFGQMLDEIEFAGLATPPSHEGFVSDMIKMRPHLYWASDALHRNYCAQLTEFSAAVAFDEAHQRRMIALFPTVSRILRRVVENMDVRYLSIIEKCRHQATTLKAYVSGRENPDLYLLIGLIEWAVEQLNCCKHQQLDMPMRQFELFLAERYGIKATPTVKVWFERIEPSPNVGPYGYGYFAKITIDVPGLTRDSAPEIQWRHARGNMKLDVKLDCPADAVPFKERRRGVERTFDDYLAVGTFSGVAPSSHARLVIDAPNVPSCDEDGWFFRNLTFYLPQTDIPGLTSFNDAELREKK